MQDLQEKHCEPCESGTQPFTAEENTRFAKNLSEGWKVIENTKLYNQYPFENFKRSMAFAQEIARLAEEEQHHPDLCIHYSSVEVELSTHAIGGLSENDYIMAAKIDNL